MSINQNKPVSPWVSVPVNKGYPINTTGSAVFIPGFYFYPFGAAPPESDNSKSSESKDDRDGCVCKKCKSFTPYAEPNQEDKSFICYGCRHGY